MENYYLSASTKAILRQTTKRHKVSAKTNSCITQAFASNRRTPTCGWVLCPLERTRSQYRMDVDGRDVNGAAHGAHCTFEIALSGATMLTLLLVCALSPRVHSIPRGPLFLKLTTKRHKVSAKIDTLHNARKRKRFPNANLWLGLSPVSHKQKTHNQIGCAFLLVDVNGLEPLTFSTSRRHSTS